MNFHIRWFLFVTLLVYIFTVVGGAPWNGDENNSTNNNDITNGEDSRWQMVKKKFQLMFGEVQYFFKNIPQIFTDDDPGNVSRLKSFIKKEVEAGENFINDHENTIGTEVKLIKFQDACECVNYSCGCCQHLEEPSIHLNSTICANVTYLSEDIGISLTVTVNDYAIFNETVSVRNPPPVCLGVPYVKEWAEACVRFHDIDATRRHFHACAEVEARMKHILIAKYELGCFDIGPIMLKSYFEFEKVNENELPSVKLV